MFLAKLRTLQSLEPADRACLLRAIRLLPVVRISLRLIGARRTQRWLVRRKEAPRESATSEDTRVRQVVRMVRIARRYHSGRTNCLSHSLTLFALLRQEGIGSDIRVGARLRDGRFEAHAWVEWRGQALGDTSDEKGDFAAFDRPFVRQLS